MSNLPEIGKVKQSSEDGTLLEGEQGFRLKDVLSSGVIDIMTQADKQGDYPVLFFLQNGVKKFALWRDELAAITFALSRQDEQSKLIDARFREYKEVPVRLVTVATKDIKKGEPVVIWRKEKVPVEFQYTKF